MEKDGITSITVSVGTLLKIVAVAAAIVALYFVRDIVVVVLISVVIASALEPSINWLGKYKISRVPAVIILYLLLVLAIFTVLFIFIPPVINEVYRLSVELPRYLNVEGIARIIPGEFGRTIADFIASIFGGLSPSEYFSKITELFPGLSGGAARTIGQVFGGLISVSLTAVISFYLSVQERGIENFLRIITPLRREKYVIDLWRRSQTKIGLWLQGQLVLGLLIGVLVFLGLTLLRVKFALLLAVLAAIFELIPIFGPVLAAVPAVLLALADGLTPGLMVIGFYIIIQQFENHLVYPLVVTKIVGVPPLLVILSLVIGAELAGFPGLILSIPVSAVLMEVFNDIERGKTISAAQA